MPVGPKRRPVVARPPPSARGLTASLLTDSSLLNPTVLEQMPSSVLISTADHGLWWLRDGLWFEGFWPKASKLLSPGTLHFQLPATELILEVLPTRTIACRASLCSENASQSWVASVSECGGSWSSILPCLRDDCISSILKALIFTGKLPQFSNQISSCLLVVRSSVWAMSEWQISLQWIQLRSTEQFVKYYQLLSATILIESRKPPGCRLSYRERIRSGGCIHRYFSNYSAYSCYAGRAFTDVQITQSFMASPGHWVESSTPCLLSLGLSNITFWIPQHSLGGRRPLP